MPRPRRSARLLGSLAVCAGAASIAGAAPATAATHPAEPVVSSVRYHDFASGGTAGGARVTVTGHHFSHVKSVRFGHSPGSHITVSSSRTLTVTAPEHPIGEVHVRVRTAAGTSKVSSHNAFDFQIRRSLDGNINSCQVVRDNSTLRCWGYNGDGELGNGTTTDSHTPTPVPGLKNVVSVATGIDQTCALLASGAIRCWGGNLAGQLGDGTKTNSLVPVRVVGLGAKALTVATGGDETCAVVVGNRAECWGFGADGQLGNGTTTSSPTPVGVHLSSVVDIDVGDSFACATRSSGTEYCWGYNNEGELGDGSTTMSTVPVRTVGINKAVATATGEQNGCVLTRSGGVRCWGSGNNGQLGNGSTADSTVPVAVSGITGATRLAFGSLHGCVLVGGRVRCWGFNNFGQLGNGTDTNSDVPVDVVGLRHVTSLGVAAGHSLAALPGGTTEAWGQNTQGQLGDGSTTNSDVPVVVH